MASLPAKGWRKAEQKHKEDHDAEVERWQLLGCLTMLRGGRYHETEGELHVAMTIRMAAAREAEPNLRRTRTQDRAFFCHASLRGFSG
jgi:hypothetical protein